MEEVNIKTIEDMVPYVQEYLLPEIQQAVEICVKSYRDDPVFNDTYTFGTQFWRNTWNRFKSVAIEYEDCPFDLCGKGNEYKLKLGPFILRHHRINEQSKLPNGAKAVKSSADFLQMKLFSDEWNAPVEIDNIVLAIDADIEKGLKEIFLGEIMPLSLESKKYKWVSKARVFLADGTEASTAEIIQFENMDRFEHQAPEEENIEVSVRLDKSKVNPRGLESKGDK
jgi:hypothetical protein